MDKDIKRLKVSNNLQGSVWLKLQCLVVIDVFQCDIFSETNRTVFVGGDEVLCLCVDHVLRCLPNLWRLWPRSWWREWSFWSWWASSGPTVFFTWWTTVEVKHWQKLLSHTNWTPQPVRSDFISSKKFMFNFLHLQTSGTPWTGGSHQC